MRIIILSIAFIICAFTAQSQVLKSAGVWYFLDVDSMTARPAVLPNGTELAYVIGTKTVYYWNRNTSTWTAYGSTFNRDSIYFDASIVGSGTVGDPWRVDSTLFATIAGVGDSIAAALGDYVEIADTAAMLSNYPTLGEVAANPTTIANTRIAYSNGTNLIGNANFTFSATRPTLNIGSTSITATTTPAFIDMGSTYSSAAGANPKINLFSNSTNVYGFGVSANSLDYMTTSPGVHNFYVSGTNVARITSAGNLLLGTTTDVPTSILTARSTTKASSPFPLQTLAEADAITGVQGNFQYETTQNGLRWYNGTRKAYALESTFARGTATRVPFFDANGQVTATDLLTITKTPSVSTLQVLTSGTDRARLRLQSTSNTSADLIFLTSGGGNASITSSSSRFTFESNQNLVLSTFATKSSLFFGGLEKMVFTTDKFGILDLTPSYSIDILATDAIAFPGGTTVQRPSTEASKYLLRYNIDTAAVEIGTHSSIWAQLATRAYARSLVNAISTANFANTNLTATGNRTHDWANYNFTWSNMKKFMWGADSLFKITKEFSGYTYAVMRSQGGQALLDLQGNNDISTNSVEIRLTDTETNNQFLLSHDNKGVGTDGFRIEHYNAINYHNSLFIDKTSRLFNVNNSFLSAGTRFSATSTINTGISSNIVRGSEYVAGTDSIAAVHFFQAVSNQSKNKDVFGVYSNASTVDTMYFRIGKTGIGYFYKNLVLSGYGINAKSATALSKTLTNQNAAFATDGTILEVERKRDTTIFLTADTDYDFSAAVTTAQIASRYNRIIIHMTLTSGVGADKTTTLHTPDANLMQCEILIRGTDNAGSYDNEINFGTNNAISSDGTNTSGYTLAQGQGLHVRVVYNGSAYKYIYY